MVAGAKTKREGEVNNFRETERRPRTCSPFFSVRPFVSRALEIDDDVQISAENADVHFFIEAVLKSRDQKHKKPPNLR